MRYMLTTSTKPTTELRQMQHGDLLVTYVMRRSSRAKRVSMQVKMGGVIELVVPLRASERNAVRFLEKNMGWVLMQVKHMTRYKDCITLPIGRADYERYKERARKFIHDKLSEINAHYGFTYNRVSIKNSRTNWGSCSAEGNLNFNYRLYHLPERLAEYVIAHELCHLAEFNHSASFWNRVAETIPEHKELRKQLRKYLL